MIDRDTAVALMQEAGARYGFPAYYRWSVTEVDGLGWARSPQGRGRTWPGVAVTPRGKVAIFTREMDSDADALRVLAALPDDMAPPHPSQADGWQPRPMDEAAALDLVHRLWEGMPNARASWQATPVEDKGWIFRSGPTSVVVTTHGVVWIVNRDVLENLLASVIVPNLLPLMVTFSDADAPQVLTNPLGLWPSPNESQAAYRQPQPLDEAAALALVRRLFEDLPTTHTSWQVTPVEGQGWIFRSGPATIVVTTLGVVRVVPGNRPENSLAAATVLNLSDITRAARSADAARSQNQP